MARFREKPGTSRGDEQWPEEIPLEGLLDARARQLFEDAAHRKDFMSQREVAKHLGVHPRTLRRWVAERKFPSPVIQSANGRKDFWLKIDVWEHEREQFKQEVPPSERARFKTADDLDRAHERRYGLIDLISQATMRKQNEMRELLRTDEAAFAKQYPNLKNWLKIRRKPVSHWRTLAENWRALNKKEN